MGEETAAALDLRDGKQRWQTRSETPGTGGAYSEPGWFDDLQEAEPGGTIVGLIIATEPHSD